MLLKWLGTKSELLEFLSEYFSVESNKFSTLDNVTCLVLKLAKSHVIFTLRRKRYKFKGRMAMILKTTSSLSQKRMVLELVATSAHLLQRPKYRTKMAS